MWTTETTECLNCGSTVDLDTAHYYATLRSDRSDSTETRTVVFCSRNCFEKWC